MSTVRFEITSYSGGQEVLKEAGPMGRFIFGLTEYPGLRTDAGAYRALLTSAPEVLDALKLCVVRDPSLRANAMVMAALASAGCPDYGRGLEGAHP